VGITAVSREVPGRKGHPYRIIIIIIIKKDVIDCVHHYTSKYARKQGHNWTKNTGVNMCQNHSK